MNAAEIGIVAPRERTQSAFDLFLIFAAANIVATTLQVGATLVRIVAIGEGLVVIVAGAAAGSALVAALATVGPRLGVPSVIAARAALGRRGALAVALVLYLSNFAWIALNNVIAASACARLIGGAAFEPLWAVALGLAATAVVAGGPRLVGLADRFAMPVLVIVGVLLTVACLNLTLPGRPVQQATNASVLLRGLDVVIGYQVSWVLMFADYSRYTASRTKTAIAVFLALALTSAWFMPLGMLAALAAGSDDPGAMLAHAGLGVSGAILLTLANVTTNFVNIYLSSLAWRSFTPRVGPQAAVWSIGIFGAVLSVSAPWLERYADFMVVLGSVLVPVGGVLLAHFFVTHRRPAPGEAEALYDASRLPAVVPAGVAAWICGTVVYHVGTAMGSTMPSLLVAMFVYVALRRAATA